MSHSQTSVSSMPTSTIVSEVTQLYPVPVDYILRPTSVEDIIAAVKSHPGALSVGGGHFSMGGQTASEETLHLDMRSFNKVIAFSPENRTIRVQAGTRWRDIQEHIDPHHLSVKIMQTYADFSVGGSLSVNVHGRYIGFGPLILSVRALRLVMANGDVIDASLGTHAEIFYGAIGGYGGIGIIVEAELDLMPNVAVERQQIKLPTHEYRRYFFDHVRYSDKVVFHNADLYPRHYRSARAVSWVASDRPLTVETRLVPQDRSYRAQRFAMRAVSTLLSGMLIREHIIDPLLYRSSPVVLRNYEAGYDVAELEPLSRKRTTYVLQEYFVPVERFDEFVPLMTRILRKHRVKIINISVRHAKADRGSVMAWAREEVFAFVLYYKQRTHTRAKDKVGVWTRELIDAVLSCGGTYYLPYQLHATLDQFHQAYPRAREFFALKQKVDPSYRLRNKLWDKYYLGSIQVLDGKAPRGSDFKTVYNDPKMRDDFYLFLKNVYNIYPEDAFHELITRASAARDADKEIYDEIQRGLPEIKPFLADFTYALPALFKQQKEIARETAELLGAIRSIDGYVEIGTVGRYTKALRRYVEFKGPLYLVNDIAPSYAPPDILDRGQVQKLGVFVPLNDYASIGADVVPDESVDLVTCYIGLHHSPLDRLDGFVRSIARMLRPRGIFIVRDHDVKSSDMHAFVALAHTVFNAGLGVSWTSNDQELRHFTSVAGLTSYLCARNFERVGASVLQDGDPTQNSLLKFTKLASL